MQTCTRKDHALSGFTVLEVVMALLVLGVFLTGAFTALVASQSALKENVLVSQVTTRARHALERIVQMSRQAVTADPQFMLLKPTTGIDSHCLRFRLIDSVDAAGQPIYDDTLSVFIYGPDSGSEPCQGLIIGRGPDLGTIHATGSGADGVLGTADDDTTTAAAGGIPAVELLIPSRFAPKTGDMFTVNASPVPIGRLLTFTIRLNARGSDGDFIFPGDLVVTERVALRQ